MTDVFKIESLTRLKRREIKIIIGWLNIEDGTYANGATLSDSINNLQKAKQ